MRYRVTMDKVDREVEFATAEDGQPVVLVDGEALEVELRPIAGGMSVRRQGRVLDVFVGGKASKLSVAAGLHRGVVKVEKIERRGRGAGSAAGGSDDELRAPMPGRVLKLLAQVGDTVEADQPVAVVEAMKMENELRAPRAGKVLSIDVQVGDAVEGGALLLRLQ